jgi:hypothetical protein
MLFPKEFSCFESLPGTSKKCSCGFLRLQYAKPIAGIANSKAAPAATPPAMAPVLEELLPAENKIPVAKLIFHARDYCRANA